MEANELATMPSGQMQKFTDMDAIVKSSFLGRLQLMTSRSPKCASGAFPINHYAYVTGQNFQDLGKEVDCVVFCWRPKAIDMSADEVISVFDKDLPSFKEISAKADNVQDSMCMYGPEFLIWIPGIKKLCTFLMGTKSSRLEAQNLSPLMYNSEKSVNGFVSLSSQEIKTKRYTWFGPLIKACAATLTYPDIDVLEAELEKFNNPPKTEVEKAPEDTRER